MLNRERAESGHQSDQPEADSDRPVEPLVDDNSPPIKTPRGLHLISDAEAKRHRTNPGESIYVGVDETQKLELTSDIESAEPETVQVNLAYTPEGLENLKTDNQQEITRLEARRDELAVELAAIETELATRRGDFSSTSKEISNAQEVKNSEQVAQLLVQGEMILDNLGQLENGQQQVVDNLDSISQRLDKVLYPERDRYDKIGQQRQAA